MHKVYPLVNSSQYPAYRFGYWLINPVDKDNYEILNVYFLS